MQRWEYLTRKEITLGDMNQLGKEGWELVAVASSAGTWEMYFYFKRPLP